MEAVGNARRLLMGDVLNGRNYQHLDEPYGAYQAGRYITAFRMAMQRIEANPADAAAMTLLAELILQGLGTRQDNRRAFEWYKLAADRGDRNALFALGLCWIAGADLEGACRGVGEFGGVRRRFEMHAGPRGGTLVNDYAHHPAELRAVLTAARQRFPGRRLLAVFQPHQHQRTLHLLQEFAEALTGADAAYIVDIYGAREAEHIKASVSARDLVAAIRSQGGEADAVGAVDAAPAFTLARHRPDDIVLLLGAGDIDRALGGIVAGI
jgi:UDP-N-acetylmuramate--alanine ligase